MIEEVPLKIPEKIPSVELKATEIEKRVKMTEKSDETPVEKTKDQKKAEKAARRAAAKANQPQSEKQQQQQQTQQQQQQQQPPQKKPQLTKAERRALQEKQRADKLAKEQQQQQQQKQQQSMMKPQRVPDDIQADRISVEKKLQKKLASAKIPARTKAQRKVMLFSHLHQYERELSIGRDFPTVNYSSIHPQILTLGLKYAEGSVSGSNARCVALMNALKAVIRDYETPENKDLARDLDGALKPYITFLKQCRPLSVSMGNAVRFVKAKLNALDASTPEQEAKNGLIEAVDNFIHENIVLAARQISFTASNKISDEGDVILTYGFSSLLRTVLITAKVRSTEVFGSNGSVGDGHFVPYSRKYVTLGIFNGKFQFGDCQNAFYSRKSGTSENLCTH